MIMTGINKGKVESPYLTLWHDIVLMVCGCRNNNDI